MPKLGTYIPCKRCRKGIGIEIEMNIPTARHIAQAPCTNEEAFERLEKWAKASITLTCPEHKSTP